MCVVVLSGISAGKIRETPIPSWKVVADARSRATATQALRKSENMGDDNARSKTRPEADSPSRPSTVLADGQSLDKIREILFGDQSRKLEHRLKELNSELEQESARVQGSASAEIQELRKRLDASEAQQKKALEAEEIERMKSLEQKAGQLDERIRAAELSWQESLEAFEHRFSSALESLTAGITSQVKELSRSQGAELTRLDADKVSRSVLSGLLQEVAQKMERDGDAASKEK